MDDFDLQQLLDEPVLYQVLGIYSDLIIQAGEERADDKQGTRWANRIQDLTGFDADQLSSIHGQLIAYGWLTFQIEDRNTGLMYRITSEGKKAISWAEKNMDLEPSSGSAALSC